MKHNEGINNLLLLIKNNPTVANFHQILKNINNEFKNPEKTQLQTEPQIKVKITFTKDIEFINELEKNQLINNFQNFLNSKELSANISKPVIQFSSGDTIILKNEKVLELKSTEDLSFDNLIIEASLNPSISNDVEINLYDFLVSKSFTIEPFIEKPKYPEFKEGSIVVCLDNNQTSGKEDEQLTRYGIYSISNIRKAVDGVGRTANVSGMKYRYRLKRFRVVDFSNLNQEDLLKVFAQIANSK